MAEMRHLYTTKTREGGTLQPTRHFRKHHRHESMSATGKRSGSRRAGAPNQRADRIGTAQGAESPLLGLSRFFAHPFQSPRAKAVHSFPCLRERKLVNASVTHPLAAGVHPSAHLQVRIANSRGVGCRAAHRCRPAGCLLAWERPEAAS